MIPISSLAETYDDIETGRDITTDEPMPEEPTPEEPMNPAYSFYDVYDDNWQLIGKGISVSSDTLSGAIILPSEYAGYPVVEISSFYAPNVTSITISENVRSTFGFDSYGTENLTEILVDENSQYLKSIDGILFDKNITKLMVVPYAKKLISYSLPETVTEIADRAFREHTELESINFGDNLEVIGGDAFYDCTSLKSLDLGDSLKSIGSNAFKGCTGISEITIPGSVEVWGSNSFTECTGLGKAVILNGVTAIPFSAFSSCDNLKEITIPASVTSAENYAFYQCYSLEKVYIDNVASWCSIYFESENSNPLNVADELYIGGVLTENIVIPEGTDEIKNNAFCNFSGMKSVHIPESVNRIGYNAFPMNHKLESVYITSIEAWCGIEFDCCLLNAKHYNYDEIALLDEGNDVACKLYIENELVTDITVPDTVTEIKKNTFYGYKYLTDITIPDSVKSIGNSAFWECSNLENADIGNKIESIGHTAFYGCSKLNEIILPEGLKSIGGNAFYGCSSIKEITLPGSLGTTGNDDSGKEGVDGGTALGEGAFGKCRGLEKVVIKNGLKAIPYSVFQGCSSLTEIHIPSSVTSINNYNFGSCNSLSKVYIDDLESWLKITFEGSEANPLSQAEELYINGVLTNNIVIPGSMSEVKDYAFAGFSGITGMTVSDNVGSIGYAAFYECKNLKTVTFGENTETIGGNAFYSCTSLEEITFPDSVKELGALAFYGCEKLSQVNLSYNITYLQYGIFERCTNLKTIYIPETVTMIEESAFEKCDDIIWIVDADSYAENFAKERNIKYRYIGQGMAFITPIDENGEEIAGDYTVNWYEKGSDTAIATGRSFAGEDDKTYEYEIILGEELSYVYYPHLREELVIEDNNYDIKCKLEKIDTVCVTGKVQNRDGEPIVDADITFTQKYNDEYTKTVNTSTDINGEYSANVSNVSSSAKLSALGYCSKTVTVIDGKTKQENINMGEISLTKLPSNKISLTFKKKAAKKAGETADIVSFSDIDDISFVVKNKTKNKEITNFEVQNYELIIGEDEVSAGDLVEITATDENQKMTANPVEVVLNSDKMGSGEILFVENGHIEVSEISGNNINYMMIFDSRGEFIKTYTVEDAGKTDEVENGDYTLLFIKKNNVLRKVSNLGKMDELGLVLNVDYVTKNAVVKNGEISELSGVVVPDFDESKLYYTLPENTGFTANTPSAATGKYIVLRAEYEIDPKYTLSAREVTIDIPDGIAFVPGSVTINGKGTAYSLGNGQLKIRTDLNKAVVRFYIYATEKNTYNIDAYLSLDNDGGNAIQPIGTASIEVSASKIIVPEKTGSTRVYISGFTMPEGMVTVYDNGVEVGTTKANKVGTWALQIELDKPYSYSQHKIYAIIEKTGVDRTERIETDEMPLIYDASYFEVSKLTMINQAHLPSTMTLAEYVTEIDYKNPKPLDAYLYWPNYPDFTFRVEFTGGDDTVLSDVYVVTQGNDGEIRKIPMIYDEVTLSWLGHARFTSHEIPQKIAVDYKMVYEDERPFIADEQMITDLKAEVAKNPSQESIDVIEHYFSADVIESSITEDGIGSATIKISAKENSLEDRYITVSSEIIENFENDGSYEEILVVNGEKIYLKTESMPGYTIKTVYDSETKTLSTVRYESAVSMDLYSDFQLFYELDDIIDLLDPLGLLYDNAKEQAEQKMQEFNDAIANNECWPYSNNQENILQTAQSCYDNIMEICNSGNEEAEKLLDNLSKCGEESLQKLLGRAMQIVASVKAAYLLNINLWLFKFDHQIYRATWAGHSSPECKPCQPGENCGPNGGGGGGNGDKMPTPNFKTPNILDPSGYVYEAVPSNRIEGVKAECYYYDYPLDEFGVAGDAKEEIFWNADEYDQVNPLYTDVNGMFHWDVPAGQWLVKFSKEGYYNTNTKKDVAADENGYLPVPPPQTEVNTEIVSKSAPTVETVNIYDDEIQIIFSQYMNINSVNVDNVKVTAGGAMVAGTIEPVNAEYDYKKVNKYASVFKFIPDSTLAEDVAVQISNVKNYAGKTMSGKSELSQTVGARPESIVVASSVDILYNSGTLLEISVSPKSAGANKTLSVKSMSPSIVGVVNDTITTDENGKALVMLSGKLPGEGSIEISLDGTDIKSSTRANVGNVTDTSNACAKVKANIASGSAVKRGTTITLSTETDGAEIYYTLDGTCPCIVESSSRIRYTGEITVEEDTFIIAYAVKAGMNDSATAGFVYSIEKAAKPKASPTAGAVPVGTYVELTTETDGAVIHYTTDNTVPSRASAIYSGPIEITGLTTIKAIAVKDGIDDSDIFAATYTLTEGNELKSMSVDFNEDGLNWYFDVSVEDYVSDAAVYVAVYDKYRQMLLFTSKTLSAEGTTLCLPKSNILNASYAKVFVWERNMRSVTLSEEFDL